MCKTVGENGAFLMPFKNIYVCLNISWNNRLIIRFNEKSFTSGQDFKLLIILPNISHDIRPGKIKIN